jgi:predicted DCC family thiol-disulfide oxidoreductase YuxK
MEETRPLLVFDGECDFCRAWIARWRRVTGDRVAYASWQDVAAEYPDRPLERFREAVQLREPGGAWSAGADAVFRTLAAVPGHGAWLQLYDALPPFRAASEAAYRFVARHRGPLARVTRALWGAHLVPPGEALTSWLFLRLAGVVFALAFASAGPQLVGLLGANGVIPAERLLAVARERLGLGAFGAVPSLLWLHPSDSMLLALCAAGFAASLAAAVGAWTGPALLVAWGCYLSITAVGQDFFWFQWDSLLLEAGFLAVLLAPWRAWSAPGADPPARGPLRLARWLLFRVMVASAAVKLASGDPTWRHLTALTFHYQTQPLPTWPAWWAHQLPAAFQRASTLAVFAIEGLAPFGLLAPRRLRFAAIGAIAGLQLLIATTGNYGFFNVTTLALCVVALDDGVWPAWTWRTLGAAGLRPVGDGPRATPAAPGARARPFVRARRVAVAALLIASVPPFVGSLRVPPAWLGPFSLVSSVLEPLRVANGYGLFAVMTTRRVEIEVEGSRDGRTWTAYGFRWKPGDVSRRPAFTGTHMPRLDWQMWFAALDDWRNSSWYLGLAKQLLRGRPEVRSLLARDPFAGAPPRFVRGTRWLYRFTTPAERRATGAWWHRERLGPFGPVLALEGERLVVVETRTVQ